MPRMLMTADTVGGVWTYALELARALYDHEIVLATMGAPLSADQWAAARAIPNLTICESAYKLEWMRDPWDDVRAAGDWLLDLEAQYQPDFVHLNSFVHGALDWRAPVLVVGHSCVLSWWRAVKGEDAPADWSIYRERVRAGLHRADLAAAPTRAMLDALEDHYGVFRQGAVVPNGVRADQFPPGEKAPFVLSAGRLWDEAKNLAALEAVAPCLPWKVCVAGDETHPDGGTRVVDGVRSLGRLSPAQMADWYGRASIYALPARYEPFGLSVLEAACAGCALVLGDIPTLRENWDGAALFVPPDDHAALEAALKRLIGSDAERQRLAAAAQWRARSFSVTRMADGYRHLYAKLRTLEQV